MKILEIVSLSFLDIFVFFSQFLNVEITQPTDSVFKYSKYLFKSQNDKIFFKSIAPSFGYKQNRVKINVLIKTNTLISLKIEKNHDNFKIFQIHMEYIGTVDSFLI